MNAAPSLEAILRAVADQAGVSVASIKGQSARGNDRVAANWPRQRFAMLVRRLRPDLSAGLIGRHLGGRNARCIADCEKAGYARYEKFDAERLTVAEVLSALSVERLPARSAKEWRRAGLERELAQLNQRVAALQADLDSLGPRP